MEQGSFTVWEKQFEKVGWFISPFVTMGFLSQIVSVIKISGDQFDQNMLEKLIAPIFSTSHLASMVVNRYPSMPVIQDYKITIGEAVKAHFLGLDHIAVGGLLPVIEGAGRRLAESRNISGSYTMSVKKLFLTLADDCKKQSITKGFGKTDEVISMMNSFTRFTKKYLFADSSMYPLSDKTNRHGIAHGKYTDKDYGTPVNFYKIISAVDFLTLVSAFRAQMSVFAPEPTLESETLVLLYEHLKVLGKFPLIDLRRYS